MWCCLATATATATATANEVDELAIDQISVRELMRLETEQTLQRLRVAKGGGGLRENRGLPGVDGLPSSGAAATRLVAIYGVGRKLMAEVQVDGRRLLFMRGRPQAVGPGRDHAMRLLSLTERCVELALNDRRESLCAPTPGVEKG